MEFSWKNFVITAVPGKLMFGCTNFPCPSRTIALSRTRIVCLFLGLDEHMVDTKTFETGWPPEDQQWWEESHLDDFIYARRL